MGIENPGFDPTQLFDSGTKMERFKLRFGAVPDELVQRVKTIDFDFASVGETVETALTALGAYIAREVAFYTKHYPPDARYNARITASLKRTYEMDELFREKKYKQLMKICLDLAVKKWEKADQLDVLHSQKTPDEIERLQQAAAVNNAHNAAEAQKAKADPEYTPEYGFAPELLRSGGEAQRQESMTFLKYAIALSRSI